MGYLVATTGRLLLPEELERQALTVVEHRIAARDGWFDPDTDHVDSLADLAAAIASYFDFLRSGNENNERRRAIARWRLTELLRERLLTDLLARNGTGEMLESLSVKVAEKQIDPYSAVEELLATSAPE